MGAPTHCCFSRFAFAVTIALLLLCATPPLFSQAVLNADGPGNTYELITSVLAPGGVPVEHPECIHPEFGRHIAEVWDAELNQYVFEFYAHVTPDNDRCINLDRQRVEIKTYDASPESLIGTVGETFTYKWRFKLPVGFQPSNHFTHIHQIKPVGGTDGDPMFTLTARKATPNKLELIHDNTTKVATVNLSSFLGIWVECIETVSIASVGGSYSMVITRVSDGATLLSYSNSNIMTIQPDNDFIRPKWGIYRSLLATSDLRDEAVRFNSFSITEESSLPVQLASFTGSLVNNLVRLDWHTISEVNNYGFFVQKRRSGLTDWAELDNSFVAGHGTTREPHSYSFIDTAVSNGSWEYRLKQVDLNGPVHFTEPIRVDVVTDAKRELMPRKFELVQNYPNPFNPSTTIQFTLDQPGEVTLRLFDILGRDVGILERSHRDIGSHQVQWDARGLASGVYVVQVRQRTAESVRSATIKIIHGR